MTAKVSLLRGERGKKKKKTISLSKPYLAKKKKEGWPQEKKRGEVWRAFQDLGGKRNLSVVGRLPKENERKTLFAMPDLGETPLLCPRAERSFELFHVATGGKRRKRSSVILPVRKKKKRNDLVKSSKEEAEKRRSSGKEKKRGKHAPYPRGIARRRRPSMGRNASIVAEKEKHEKTGDVM